MSSPCMCLAGDLHVHRIMDAVTFIKLTVVNKVLREKRVNASLCLLQGNAFFGVQVLPPKTCPTDSVRPMCFCPCLALPADVCFTAGPS